MLHIILVAGPSCCGKSRFCNSLINGELPEVERQLGLGEARDWPFQDAFYLTRDSSKNIDFSSHSRVLLHWTISRPTLGFKLRNCLLGVKYEREERVSVLRAADAITLLTLHTSTEVLCSRVRMRAERSNELLHIGRKSKIDYWKHQIQLKRLFNYYSDQSRVDAVYREWFSFVSQFNVKDDYLVDVTGSPALEIRQSR